MSALAQPSGTVTLVFTDIEGSTKLLEELGTDGYKDALAEHRRIVRAACSRYSGYEVDYEGDAFFYAFSSAGDAVSAVSEAMAGLEEGPISIRVGIHTGEPALDPPKYVGIDVHRAARIMSAAHGGQVVLSPTTVSLLVRDDLGIVELGQHRLKDLSAAIPLYQLGAGVFPALKTLHQTNLPTPATPFLGREKELAEVCDLVARDDVRLLTLTGPGGTGKTRLGAQAAAMLAERFPDGVWWVALAPLRDPDLVVESTSQVVGATNGLASHIAGKRMLVLLDNFEQVVEAAPGLGELLSECPHLELLVTSREPLHLAGEQEYSVPPFAVEEGVGFFLARARAVQPDFAVDEAVPEICRRLDSLPLALELAASRVRALSTVQILSRLEERLPLLTGGSRDAPERQRTLRATIEWSYDLLSPREQALFVSLSVFSGGCTLDAAEEVCDASLDTMQSLVEKSLVRHTDGRYWMLETIREYATERLGAEHEDTDLERRHAHWCLALSAVYEPELMGPMGVQWFARIEAEIANVRLAIAWGLENDKALAFAIVVNTSYFWSQTARTLEEARLLEATWIDDVHVELRKRALKARTGAALGANDFSTLMSISNERAELARATGDVGQEAAALGMLATGASLSGDYPTARSWYEAGLALHRNLTDERGLATMLGNFGIFERNQGNLLRSRELLEESLAISRVTENDIDVAFAVKELGMIAIEVGELDAARTHLVEGFEIASRVGLSVIAGDLVYAVALLVARAGRSREAAVLYGAVDAHDERTGWEHTPEQKLWWAFRYKLADALGESELEAVMDEGRALDLQHAVERARALLGES